MSSLLEAHIAAMAATFVGSLVGIMAPMRAKSTTPLGEESPWYWFFRSVGTGSIISVALCHSLVEASDALNELAEFPWANALCLLSLVVVALISQLAGHGHDHGYAHGHGATASENDEGMVVVVHAHSATEDDFLLTRGASLRKTIFLDVSLATHSILIGLALGLETDVAHVFVLCFAFFFHQLFEGLALGASIMHTTMARSLRLCLISAFVGTTPLGVLVGMFLGDSIDLESTMGLWTTGIINALVAGNLCYIGLVEFLANDFGSKQVTSNFCNKVTMSIGLIIGSISMAIIAIWA